MANGEWRIGMIVDRPVDQFISGPEGMAGRYDLGGVLLSVDAPISSRRAFWTNIANPAFGGISSSQYRGRSRSAKYRQLHAAFVNRARLSEGTRNAPAFGGAGRYLAGARFAACSRAVRGLGKNASRLDTIASGQVREMMPFAIRYSPFAKARSALQ